MNNTFLGGTLEMELELTADMLVEIAEERGLYFAIALLVDASYDNEKMRLLLPYLEKKMGAIKP